MSAFWTYVAMLKQAAAVPVLPHALAHPYQFVEQDTGGPTLQGAGWGAGLGALAGGALGSMSHVHTGLGGAAIGALAGGILGGSIGHGMKVDENWGLHRQAVRDWEAAHGPLPYDISHARNVRRLQRLKGQAAGLAADTLISGSITGISDRDYYGRRGYGYGYGYGRGTSTYGMGHSMGAAYGNLSAQDQVGRAVAEYQRELANQRGRR
jgi:hypothetical protein